MSIETKLDHNKSDDNAQWARVREAVTSRWPHINRDELADCPNETCKLTEFVANRVDASEDEIQAVVAEFAPQEPLAERLSHVTSDALHQFGESAQLAYAKADDCIAERPTESVLASFVAGVILGATVTALLIRSKPQPTIWDRARDRSWS